MQYITDLADFIDMSNSQLVPAHLNDYMRSQLTCV